MNKNFETKKGEKFQKIAADAQLLFPFDLFIKEITITHKLQHHFYPFAFKTLYAYKNMSSILKHHYFSPFHPSFLHKIFLSYPFSLSPIVYCILFSNYPNVLIVFTLIEIKAKAIFNISVAVTQLTYLLLRHNYLSHI